MSDKIIKISSQQGFSDTWLNAAEPTNLNLCDFRIPAGMTVSLKDSYIAFNVSLAPAGDVPLNTVLTLDNLSATGENYMAPNSCLIRNARMTCDRGQVESIRRVDTLKCAMWNLEHDTEEQQDDLNAFTAPKSVRGVGNQTSYFLDAVKVSLDDDDVAITGAVSRNLTRDVKVPLSEIFGIGQVDDWDTSKFGETRIHLETNWNKVKSVNLGGHENESLNFAGGGLFWGSADDVTLAVDSDLTAITLSTVYGSQAEMEQLCPFFVSQKILYSATASGTLANAVNVATVVNSMGFDETSGKVVINFNSAVLSNPAGGTASDITDAVIKADTTIAVTNTVNRAELVLMTRPGVEGDDEYEYVTYSTEQDNGNGINSFSRGYVIEPEAQNMMVCLTKANEILPGIKYKSYRYAIDNVDQTGNRSVEPNSTLQFDRLQRCLTNTSTGMGWRNAQLKFFNWTPNTDNSATQEDAYDKPNSTICETLLLTDRPKYVDLQIETTGTDGTDTLADIIIYKQMVKSIKA